MNKINLLDNTFSPDKYSSRVFDQKFVNDFKWDVDVKNVNEKIVVTDNFIDKSEKYNNKIGWLIESKEVSGHIYYNTKSHLIFDKILTHDRVLLESNSDKYKFVPVGGCWVKHSDQKIYKKDKLLNIIASSKNWTTGHKLRHQIILKFGEKINPTGGCYGFLDYKLDALKDYMFQIVVENSRYDYYFTEKLIDCMRTGVIPIYWGCPSIGDFFDINGILQFSDIEELDQIINNLNIEKYENMFESVKNNFEIAKKYVLTEKYMIDNNLLFFDK